MVLINFISVIVSLYVICREDLNKKILRTQDWEEKLLHRNFIVFGGSNGTMNSRKKLLFF